MDTSDDQNDSTQQPQRKRPTAKATINPTPTIEIRENKRHEYDPELIEEFLDMVFGSVPQDEGEEILTWGVKVGRPPGYPDTPDDLLETVKKYTRPLALYYGTATCGRNDIGQLRNQQALFNRLYVIVLDDIGTKIDVENIPKALKPTYIVESSKGNYQWG
ncbi:unnamed protein product, partial [marine sediment metagenome]